MGKLYDKFLNWGTDAIVNLFTVFFLIVIGFKVVRIVIKYLSKFLAKRKVEASVAYFIENFCNVLLKIIIVLTGVTILGLPTTSLVTLLGSFGIAIGLAVQGGLSNIVGGITILILKPFKIDDYIAFNGIEGKVSVISVFYTVLNTFDNKKVVVPNGQLANSIVTNYTANKERRIDLDFKVSIDTSVNKVKKVITDIIAKEKLVLKDKGSIVRLSKFEDSWFNITVKVWALTDDYWTAFFNLQEEIREGLDKAGINFPYQKLDVQMINEKNK